jgi:long-chain acyl-CoA synthetase
VSVYLATRGIAAGDRVVVWAPNSIQLPAYLFAIWKLGGIVVPFDRDMNAQAAIAIIASVQPRAVILGYDQRPAWAPPDAWRWPEEIAQAQPMMSGSGWTPPAEELAAVFFTSGTTGQPKGCMITHANLWSQLEVFHDRIPIDASCRLGSILPLSHLFELTCGLLYPLLQGAAIHYIPSRRPQDIVGVLKEQHVTHMMAVPQLLSLMGAALEKRLQQRLPPAAYRALLEIADRSPMGVRRQLFFLVHQQIGGRLRLMAAGGAALAPETQRLWERLGVDVVQGYGASECSPVIACGEPRITPAGSVGPPLAGVRVRLSSESELQVHGPNVMRGYWRDPERTAEVLSADGWYATGDLATIDRRGNIWLQGRARDLIVLPNGMNVWPRDVEDALRADDQVRDAAVVPVVRPGGGTRLHAYLLPMAPSMRGAETRSIVARANSHLAAYQRVATASWWPEADFPRTSTLKVRRHLLPMPGGTADESAATPPIEGDPIAESVAAVAHLTRLREDQKLAEMGLDSLGLVELAARVEEQTGRLLTEGQLSTELTLADLRRLVAAAPAADSLDSSTIEDRQRLPLPAWFYRYGWAARPLLALPFDLLYAFRIPRTVVLGGERLRGLPSSGVVFAGNHRSFADMPLVRIALARTPARRFSRRLIIAAMAEGAGWRSPLARYVAAAFGIYPLERQSQREASLRRLADLARGGGAVLIFPQGTHARPSDERGDPPAARFKTGVAHLAEALDAPVVPFGLAGTDEAMPPFLDDFHGLVIGGVPVSLRRKPLAIAFGSPQRPDPDETPQHFVQRLEQLSYALAAEADAALGR